jgi:hypothetical protein
METRSSKYQPAVALDALGRPADQAASLVQVVSLGNSCATKLSIRRLGLDEATLPCDWIRSSMQGLLHWLKHDFEGFLETDQRYDLNMQGCAMTVYRSHAHSFWHDDISDASAQEKLRRRVDRFLGLSVDSASQVKPRTLLFVRSVASSAELANVEGLFELLKERFGHQGRSVRLLVIIDGQSFSGPVRHARYDDSILFWIQPLFTGKLALDCSALSPYETAIAFAVRRLLDGPSEKEAACKRVEHAAEIVDRNGPLRELDPKAIDSGLWVGNVQLKGFTDDVLFAAFEGLDTASAACSRRISSAGA